MIQIPTKRTLLISGIAVLLAIGLWLGWGRSGGTGSGDGGYLIALLPLLLVLNKPRDLSPLQRRALGVGTALILAGGGVLWYVLN